MPAGPMAREEKNINESRINRFEIGLLTQRRSALNQSCPDFPKEGVDENFLPSS